MKSNQLVFNSQTVILSVSEQKCWEVLAKLIKDLAKDELWAGERSSTETEDEQNEECKGGLS